MSLKDQLDLVFARIGAEIKSLNPTPINATATNTGADTMISASAAAGKKIRIRNITFSYDAVPSGGLVSLSIDAGTASTLTITNSGPGPIPVNAETAIDGNFVVTLANGGTGVKGDLWVDYYEC